ncbi:hypothetical protein LCGC14_0400710 [marine sediment metagenome]|uniref:YopX protein domain-containing protein n=1 Tax=marine sediment metagenome TaxID=412755 RepID=A0A0F9SX51_9ZZZZ
MNREIKFRAWFVESKKMYSWEELINDIGLSESIFIETDLWKPMQYTGLKDRKDKEIHEGDIVKIPGNNPLDVIGEVYWNEYSLTFTVLTRGICRYPSQFWEWKDLEVIGTIHQDKALLETQ